tara:strand:- start:304 stop:531 length:228 start_codon:yes stop_codon:yes gene_type:complete
MSKKRSFTYDVGDLVKWKQQRITEDFIDNYENIGIVIGHEQRYSKEEHVCKVQVGNQTYNIRTHMLKLVSKGIKE